MIKNLKDSTGEMSTKIIPELDTISPLNPQKEEYELLKVGTTFMALGKEYVVTYVNEGKKRATIEPYSPKK